MKKLINRLKEKLNEKEFKRLYRKHTNKFNGFGTLGDLNVVFPIENFDEIESFRKEISKIYSNAMKTQKKYIELPSKWEVYYKHIPESLGGIHRVQNIHAQYENLNAHYKGGDIPKDNFQKMGEMGFKEIALESRYKQIFLNEYLKRMSELIPDNSFISKVCILDRGKIK